MCDLQTIFDTVNIECFNGWNVEGVGESFTDWDTAIEGAGVVSELAGASEAGTVVFIDVLVFQDGASAIIDNLTLSKDIGVVDNWLDGGSCLKQGSSGINFTINWLIPIGGANHGDDLSGFDIN